MNSVLTQETCSSDVLVFLANFPRSLKLHQSFPQDLKMQKRGREEQTANQKLTGVIGISQHNINKFHSYFILVIKVSL